jgi:hypothetical protein
MPKGDYKFAVKLMKGLVVSIILIFGIEVLFTIVDFFVTSARAVEAS